MPELCSSEVLVPHRVRRGRRGSDVLVRWPGGLGYFLLYGSYEADRDLAAFHTRCGYTTQAPGETCPLDRIALPFRLGAGDDQCVFTRWRARR
ncbi:hypothetical protein GCM10010103_16160 [Streptomyces paradoxus]|uniref:Uncharacterized protein n=1 Tax=Streptomyces paradoxus TaxID=66375 RepID=A0A7W9T970_9ACTN|nr:hypothetical protein [Streptomyces paradoxus]MBB6075721.1 hypothetical protein [Streptomyces paradoxus]